MKGVEFELEVPVKSARQTVTAPILARKITGQQYIIALSDPLTIDHPADPAITEYRDHGGEIAVIVENELIVRGNLPAATNRIQREIGV